MISIRPAKSRPARVLAVGTGLLAVVAGLWLAGRRPPDVMVEGQSLRRVLHAALSQPHDLELRSAAVASLRKAGPLGVPVLSRELRRRPSLLAPLAEWPLPARVRQPVLRQVLARESRVTKACDLVWAAYGPGTVRAETSAPRTARLEDRAEFRDTSLPRDLAGVLVRHRALTPVWRAAWGDSASGAGFGGLGDLGLDALLGFLTEGSAEEAEAAIQVLGNHFLVSDQRERNRPDLVAAVTAWLESHPQAPSGTAEAALAILGGQGPQAAPALPVVLRLLGEAWADQRVLRAACRALGEIRSEPQASVPALQRALKDQDPTVRAAAAEALRAFGPAAAPAVPDLAAALGDRVVRVQVAAAATLARIGPAAAGAAEPLMGRLHDAETIVRSGAARTLGRIGAPPDRAVPALSAALADPAPDVRRHAAEALGWFGPAAAPALPQLTRLLRDGEIPVRLAAIGALGRMGPAARAAVPELHAARNNDQSGVGRPVLEALERIEGRAPPAVGGWDATGDAGR